ncbi:MAG: YfiR family protein [Terriglobales bacterium]
MAAIVLMMATSLTLSADELHPSESQVEAAYLYNFGKFVTWPSRSVSADSFEICVLGKDPFGPSLDAIVKGESIDRKTIRVRRLSNVQQGQSCAILFISSSEENHLPALVAAAQNFSVLTVSDIKHFADRGGIIGLVRQDDKVRFEVNRGAAEQSHLVLSSELLKVAIRVIQKAEQGS